MMVDQPKRPSPERDRLKRSLRQRKKRSKPSTPERIEKLKRDLAATRDSCDLPSESYVDCKLAWQLVEAIEAENAKLREERDRLRVSLKGSELDVAEAQDECLGLESVLAMAVSRLGGNVEGKPTHRMNFLQRIDALRSIEHQHSMRALRKIQVTAMGPVLACPEGLAEHRKADYHQPYEHCPVTIRRQQARLAEAEALLREIKETDAAAIAELDDLGFSSTGVDRTLVDKVQAFLAAGKGGDDG